MGTNEKVFRANRLVLAFFLLVSIGVTSLIFLPGAAEWVQFAHMRGKLRMFEAWEPRHRMMVAWVVTGLFALMSVGYLRLLIDNRMVVLDSDGISVKQPLWFTKRARWADLINVKKLALIGNYTRLYFAPGADANGRRLARKITLPSPILGVDNKAVLDEAANIMAGGSEPPRPQAGRMMSTAPAPAPERTVAPAGSGYSAAGPAPRVFGKRRA